MPALDWRMYEGDTWPVALLPQRARGALAHVLVGAARGPARRARCGCERVGVKGEQLLVGAHEWLGGVRRCCARSVEIEHVSVALSPWQATR